VTQRFPASEYDVLVVVEGDGLLARPSIEKLRELAIDLQLVDGTRGLISMFSAREPPQNDNVPGPLFRRRCRPATPTSADRPCDGERDHPRQAVVERRQAGADGAGARPRAVDGGKLKKIIGDVARRREREPRRHRPAQELSGVPVMQLEIRNAIERDRLIYNSLGFIAGCLIRSCSSGGYRS